jgi:hypothetical protein
MMKILACTCEHEFQDETYGKGKRAMNPKDSKEGEYTCTVCGKVHIKREGVKPVKK